MQLYIDTIKGIDELNPTFIAIFNDIRRLAGGNGAGTWLPPLSAPPSNSQGEDGQWAMDIVAGTLYYNIGGIWSLVYTIGSGSTIIMKTVPVSSFVGDTYTDSDLSGKTPESQTGNGFMVFTNATMSNRISYTATPAYWTFAGTTITMVNGAEEIFLFIT